MTSIAMMTDGKTVVLGGDSAALNGYELRVRAEPKVFRAGSYAIGFTTSFRMGQILRYCTELPEPPAGAGPEELERFIVTDFIATVRSSFAEHGFAKTARFTSTGPSSVTEEGQDVGGQFLVAVAGQIFEIHQDYHVGRPATPYAAFGLGAAVALGAFYALESMPDLSLRERVVKALEASEAHSSGVRGPFDFVELPS
jgi:hypothetical protein